MPDLACFPIDRLRPKRSIEGLSAILLPFSRPGEIDWNGLTAHLRRTQAAGLIPAVNMDTGYVALLDAGERRRVLEHTVDVLGGTPFVAGAFVADSPGASWNPAAYQREMEQIQIFGGTPVIIQSFGLVEQMEEEVLQSYLELAAPSDRFIGFELGNRFAPQGRIYSLEFFRSWLRIPQMVGAKHSSLSRLAEWDRLQIRDELRPDFRIYTGNDLAIDMVMYGSDYLLGLSTFGPAEFALRDRLWEAGDPRFYELNDQLQFLGAFAFRIPTPAYKHSAAQFLKLRGWIENDVPPHGAARRPAADESVLQGILESLRSWHGEL